MVESLAYPDYEEMERYWNSNGSDSLQPTDPEELIDDLIHAGLEGKDVMVHASYKCMRPVMNGPQSIVDAFCITAGRKGAVLFPTYDFNTWPKEHYFDRRETPSQMGVITEVARKDSRFRRTSHPMLSYALYTAQTWQKYDEDLHDSHGPGSLFERFEDNGGFLVSIGALSPQNIGFDTDNVGFTFIHHAEATAGARYRRYKTFGGIYIDNHRQSSTRTYRSYVRKLEYRTAVSPAMREMEKDGVVSSVKFGRSVTHVAAAQDVGEWVRQACHERPELLREEVKR